MAEDFVSEEELLYQGENLSGYDEDDEGFDFYEEEDSEEDY